MSEERHKILGGKVTLYRRGKSGNWHASTFLDGAKRRTTTGDDSLSRAKEFAEDWYLTLKGKKLAGTLSPAKAEKTFRDAATQYEKEYAIITGGQRNQVYVDGNFRRIKKYLNPFFGDLGLSEVTSAKVQDYRLLRHTPVDGIVPATNTLHQEIVTLRQVLKTALRHGWLSHLPDLSAPYQSSRKISHRAWFSRPEYDTLVKALRARVQKYDQQGHPFMAHAELVLDYVLILANTGLRPDEAKRLQFRDVEIAEDQETGETILVIEVRGKRGVGYCKSTASAVFPFERMVKRLKPKPDDLLFPGNHLMLFNNVLAETNLKVDREGQSRTAYSLRHTYICFRLMDGADIYQIAKNCRTSVEMIEKYYASHIQTSISAAAINVQKKPLAKKKLDALGVRNAHRVAAQDITP